IQAALLLYEELGDRRGIAHSTGGIGIVHQSLGEWAKALEKFQSAYALTEELGIRSRATNWLGNIGHLYANPSFEGYDPDRAEEILLRAIDMAADCEEKWLQYQFHQWL